MTSAFGALVRVLDQIAEVVRALPDDEFCAPGIPGVSGSVGAHVRHCLEHVEALEQALQTWTIDYDVRQRGGSVESNRHLAIAALDAARARLLALDDRWLMSSVQVRSLLAPGERTVVTHSTIGRELAFVISHTIHHNATINVLLRQRRVMTPAEFGFAASTPCVLSA